MSTDLNTLSDEEYAKHFETIEYDEGLDGEDLFEEEPLVEDNTANSDDEDENIEEEQEEEQEENLDESGETVATEQPNETDSDDTTTQDDETNIEPNNVDASETKEPKVEDAPATWSIKADGIDFELTEKELKELASKGINYTKKMQRMKPHLTNISALEENGIAKKELDLLISAYKGDKGAINELIKKNNIEVFDLDPEAQQYEHVSYGKSEVEQEMLSVLEDISRDEEYRITEHIITNMWDEESKAILTKSFTDRTLRTPNGRTLLEGLHSDVKDGTYDRLAPIMIKKKVMDGGRKSDLAYYLDAARELDVASRQQEEIKAFESKIRAEEEAKRLILERQIAEQKANAKEKEISRSRKSAAITKNTSKGKDIQSYLPSLNVSDDEFNAFMERELNK